MKKLIIVLLVTAPFTVFGQSVFEYDLAYGTNRKTDVTQLQEFLSSEGLYAGPITGNFFSLTLGAVKAFQSREGITPAAGYFGPKTRARANALLGTQISTSNQQAVIETGRSTQPVTASSVSSTQSQLDALLKQIVLLQEQLKAQQQNQATGVSTSPSTAPTVSINITPSSGTSNASAGTYVSVTPQNAVFYDDFSNGFSTSKWVFQNDYTNTPTQPVTNTSLGKPAPSLSVLFPSYGQNHFIISATDPFNTENGLTASIDVRQPNLESESGPWIRNFRFGIFNQNDGKIVAYADISPSNRTISYRMSNNIPSALPGAEAPYSPDTSFHNFKFTVDAYGNSKWYRDGILKASATGFPVGDYQIRLMASGHANVAQATEKYFHSVDNALVTIP